MAHYSIFKIVIILYCILNYCNYIRYYNICVTIYFNIETQQQSIEPAVTECPIRSGQSASPSPLSTTSADLAPVPKLRIVLHRPSERAFSSIPSVPVVSDAAPVLGRSHAGSSECTESPPATETTVPDLLPILRMPLKPAATHSSKKRHHRSHDGLSKRSKKKRVRAPKSITALVATDATFSHDDADHKKISATGASTSAMPPVSPFTSKSQTVDNECTESSAGPGLVPLHLLTSNESSAGEPPRTLQSSGGLSPGTHMSLRRQPRVNAALVLGVGARRLHTYVAEDDVGAGEMEKEAESDAAAAAARERANIPPKPPPTALKPEKRVRDRDRERDRERNRMRRLERERRRERDRERQRLRQRQRQMEREKERSEAQTQSNPKPEPQPSPLRSILSSNRPLDEPEFEPPEPPSSCADADESEPLSATRTLDAASRSHALAAPMPEAAPVASRRSRRPHSHSSRKNLKSKSTCVSSSAARSRTCGLSSEYELSSFPRSQHPSAVDKRDDHVPSDSERVRVRVRSPPPAAPIDSPECEAPSPGHASASASAPSFAPAFSLTSKSSSLSGASRSLRLGRTNRHHAVAARTVHKTGAPAVAESGNASTATSSISSEIASPVTMATKAQDKIGRAHV